MLKKGVHIFLAPPLRCTALWRHCCYVTLRFRVENNSPCFSGAIIFAMIEEHIYVERIVLRGGFLVWH